MDLQGVVSAVPHTENELFLAKLEADIAEQMCDAMYKLSLHWKETYQEILDNHDFNHHSGDYLRKMMYDILYETYIESLQDSKEKREKYKKMCAENEMYEEQVKNKSEISAKI